MSISRISSTGVNVNPETRSIWTTLITTLSLSVFMLSVLDLIAVYIRYASLSNYTMYVLTNVMLTAVGLITCSDLVVAKGSKSVKSFLGYMLLSWTCITLIRLFQS